ncbi:MAG: hypothetical protein EOO12_02110 [Chitinophagaceae bacterium]|nr:MAG: hypothetical protein EOO12_02110 [Chitinophagaceae bacterium]
MEQRNEESNHARIRTVSHGEARQPESGRPALGQHAPSQGGQSQAYPERGRQTREPDQRPEWNPVDEIF